MPEPTAERKDDTLTIVCPCCQEMYEITNPTLILLAHHLETLCPETDGVLHGSA